MKQQAKVNLFICFGMILLTISAQLKDQGQGNIGTQSNKFNGAGNIAFGQNNKFNGHYNLDIGNNNLISGSLNVANGDGNLIQGNGNVVSGQGNLVMSPNDVNMNEIMKKFNTDALTNQIQGRLGIMSNNMLGNVQPTVFSQSSVPAQVNTNYMQNVNSQKPGQSLGLSNVSPSYQSQNYQNPINNIINQNLQNLQTVPKYNTNSAINQNTGTYINPNIGTYINPNIGVNSQSNSYSPYSTYQAYTNQNSVYGDLSQNGGVYWGNIGGQNYNINPVIGQVGGYQMSYQPQPQPYVPYGVNIYQQGQYYPQYPQYQQPQLSQFSYPNQYQSQYYQPYNNNNQQYTAPQQVTYPQLNPYQQQSYQTLPPQQQSYQQVSYSPQSLGQNNLRTNQPNYQNSYQNSGFNNAAQNLNILNRI